MKFMELEKFVRASQPNLSNWHEFLRHAGQLDLSKHERNYAKRMLT